MEKIKDNIKNVKTHIIISWIDVASENTLYYLCVQTYYILEQGARRGEERKCVENKQKNII